MYLDRGYRSSILRSRTKAYKALSEAVDAKGRKLKVHKFAVPKKMVCIKGADGIDYVEGTIPREEGEMAIASYLNFLIVNGGIILPQFGDENDELAMEQAKAIFPDYEVVGVRSEEVAYGGGNIHCITQQQPKRLKGLSKNNINLGWSPDQPIKAAKEYY